MVARTGPRVAITARRHRLRRAKRNPVAPQPCAWRLPRGLRAQYPAPMDDIDRRILDVLNTHGRIANADLAAKVGLSPSPCLRRVRRLEDAGVIRGYRAIIDPAAIGRGLRVMVGVRLARHAHADVSAFEAAVVELAEVVETHHVTGNFDYILDVEVADLPAYEEFHANRLAGLPAVAAVNSYVVMKSLSRF